MESLRLSLPASLHQQTHGQDNADGSSRGARGAKPRGCLTISDTGSHTEGPCSRAGPAPRRTGPNVACEARDYRVHFSTPRAVFRRGGSERDRRRILTLAGGLKVRPYRCLRDLGWGQPSTPIRVERHSRITIEVVERARTITQWVTGATEDESGPAGHRSPPGPTHENYGPQGEVCSATERPSVASTRQWSSAAYTRRHCELSIHP